MELLAKVRPTPKVAPLIGTELVITMIDNTLLEILVCPKCKAKVHYNTEKNGLICDTCQLEYPVRDDIPVMLIDEATTLTS